MTITTIDGIVAALPGTRLPFYFPSQTTKNAGTFQSYWSAPGFPGPSAIPAAGLNGAIPTQTDSRFKFTNPSAPALTYLAKFAGSVQTTKALILYDRLWHNNGFNGTTTPGAQSVTQGALTRPDANGGDAEIWLEFYTPTGGTASNVTVSYTNSAGTASRTTPSQVMPATPVAGQIFPLPLQAGDDGVKSVQSLTLSASTGVAGDFGIVIARRIATLNVTTSGMQWQDAFDSAMPQIYDSACLAFAGFEASTTSGIVVGDFALMQG